MTPYPRLPDRRATVFIAVSVLILAYSWRFNVIAILAFLVLWLAHTLYQKRFILFPDPTALAVFLLPLIACYSSLWSDFPGKSIYQGAEFMAMAACVVIISRLVSLDALLKGLCAGCAVVLILSLLNGTYANDAFGARAVLIGLFHSKNQIGLFAEIGLVAAIILAVQPVRFGEKLIYVGGIAPLAIVSLFLCKSATSTLSLLVVLAALAGVYLITRLPRPLRIHALLAGFFALISLMVLAMAFQIDPQSTVLEGLGKNTTLTGRTYLWSEGLRIGLERPWFGHGYAAFWVQGQNLPEKYWEEFYIASRTGFHFHNMYIQTLVDLGLIGAISLALLVMYTFIKTLFLNIWYGLNGEYIFALAMATMFLVRSVVEVDFLGPFGIGPLLALGILPRLAGVRPVPSKSATDQIHDRSP